MFCIEQRLRPRQPYDAYMVNEKHKNHPDDVTLAEHTKEMNESRTTASARKALELAAAAIGPFHPNE
jgi:hypothetical protein